MANELVVKNAKTVSDLLEKQRDAISKAIPKQAGLEVDQFIRVGLTTLRTNPKLLECTPESIISGMLRSAQDGFTLDPNMGQAYLVPFRNNKTGVMEAQYIRGYRGLISLMTRFGEVKFVTAHVVYEQDTFDIEYGQEERLVHRPYLGDGDRGNPIGAYAVAHFKDSGSTFVWMSLERIEKIRKTSKTYSKKDKRNFGPWHDWTEAMQQKCPVRQLHKLLPINPGLMVFHQAAAEDEAEDLGYSVSVLPEPERGNITDSLTPGEVKAVAEDTPPTDGKKSKRGKPKETKPEPQKPEQVTLPAGDESAQIDDEIRAKRDELNGLLKRYETQEEKDAYLKSCTGKTNVNQLGLDELIGAIENLSV
jgi:recombination protein RecT